MLKVPRWLKQSLLVVMWINSIMVDYRTLGWLTFANASTLRQSESEHSVALTNRSRKFMIVGPERSKFIVWRTSLSIFRTCKKWLFFSLKWFGFIVVKFLKLLACNYSNCWGYLELNRNQLHTQVKSQVGCRRDPAIPTWDPGWEWRDPALVGGIPPFPPGTQM